MRSCLFAQDYAKITISGMRGAKPVKPEDIEFTQTEASSKWTGVKGTWDDEAHALV